MGEMISDFVNEHKKMKKMIDRTLFKVGGYLYYWFLQFVRKRLMQKIVLRLPPVPPSKEEERKRRVLEAEKKRAEEAKRKEMYDLMKVSAFAL